LVWSHQEFKGDSFMVGFDNTNEAGGNWPQTLGPDWDFVGSSVIMQQLADRRDILLAAGKGRVAIALNPDRNGDVVWRTKLYWGTPPSAMGLVVFGDTANVGACTILYNDRRQLDGSAAEHGQRDVDGRSEDG
jgi:polyvinyl alcohol dehydrogenase (cytochrome)